MRRCHDRDEIASRTRVAAGEMHLQNAERRGLGEHARPGLRVKLASSRVERERVGAIRTAQRTAVRKLGKEAEGLVENGTIFRHVEFTFVMAGSRSPPRNAAGAPGHDGLVVTIPRASCSASPRRIAVTSARMRSRGRRIAFATTIAANVAAPGAAN